jgi:hypothetical protein
VDFASALMNCPLSTSFCLLFDGSSGFDRYWVEGHKQNIVVCFSSQIVNGYDPTCLKLKHSTWSWNRASKNL